MKILGKKSSSKNEHHFLSGGGEMGALTRAKDWSKTSLGPVDCWPQSLRTTLSILLNSRFPMFLWWGPQLICFYNDAYRPSLGENGKHPAILGTAAEEAWPEIWDIIKPLIDRVLAGDGATWSEDQLIPIYRNGKIEDVYWTFSYSPVIDETGDIAGVLVTCSETTQKINTVKSLEESNRKYFNNIIQAPIAMCIFRGKTHVVEIANDLMLELWGKTKEQVMNKPIFEGLPEVRGQGFEQLLDNVYDTGEKFVANERLVNLPRDGKIEAIYINFMYEASREPDGTISGIVAIASEVTPQVIARKKTEESEERFRTMAEGTDILIAVGDETSNAIYFNKAWVDLTGRPLEDLLEFGWADLVHPEDRERYINIYLNAFKKREAFTGEFRILNKEGDYRWLLAKGPPRFRNDGSFAGYISSCIDITERKQVEEERRKVTTIIEASTEFIGLTDTSAVAQYINPAALKMMGWESFEGRHIIDCIFPDDRELAKQIIPELFQKGHFRQEIRFWNEKTGEPFWLQWNGISIKDPVTNEIVGLATVSPDITERKRAEQALQESEKRVRSLVESAPFPIGVYVGREMKVVLANQSIMDIWGKGKDVIGKLFSEVLPELSNQEVFKQLDEVFTTGVPYHTKNQQLILDVDGKLQPYYFNYSLTPLYDTRGEIYGVMNTGADVTDLNVAKQKTEESEKRFRNIADSVPVLIWMADTHKLCNFFNKAWLNFTGRSMEEESGNGWVTGIHPDDSRECVDLYTTSFDKREEFYMEYRLRRYNGEYRWISCSGAPRFTTDGTFEGYIGACMDIHERIVYQNKLKENEERLKESAERLVLATEGTQQATWDLNLQNSGIIHSPRLSQIFGHEETKILTHAQMRGQIHPDDIHTIVEKAFEVALETGTYYYQARIVLPDKTIRWIRTRGKVIFNDDHIPLRMLGTLMDITESQLAEENIARMAAIVHSSDDAIISKNLNGIITTWNAGAERIFGYTADEMIGQSLLKLIPPDKAEEEPKILAQLRKGERVDHFETRRITKDNKILDVSLTISPVRDIHGNIIGASKIARDITMQKEAELLLITSEQKFRLLADSMPQIIWTGDAEGNIRYFNQALFDYTGLAAEQVNEDTWIQIVHPDDREENMRIWKDSVMTGKDFIFEHRFRLHSGDYRWQLSRAIPQRDLSGNIRMWVGTSTDIHNMKEQESQKDYFISMASHELKTPITSMKGYVQILQTLYLNSEDAFLKKSLNIIDKQIITLTNLITDLLDLSKIKSGKLLLNKEEFPINELVDEIIDEIKHSHPGRNITFLRKSDAFVYADRDRIGQVVINFLTNAIKYSPGLGEVKIDSSFVDGNVIISVEDSGIGINKKDQEKIFERFYRVEGKNEKTFPGFGIGLFIASEIIQRHEGKIGVKSDLGKGSVFYFSLPYINR